MTLIRRIGLFLLTVMAVASAQAGQASNVVVIVWDGMRPDFVRADLTPVLHKLAGEGTFFTNHHPVYISTTEVNGTALATGDYPAVSTIVANAEYRPEIHPRKAQATESLDTMRKADKLSGGHYLQAPTVAEILQSKGYQTLVVGTKPVAFLHDRKDRPASATNITLADGRSLPPQIATNIIKLQGAFPDAGSNRIHRDIWTSDALLTNLWSGSFPAFTLLWLGEPDGSQHNAAPGSANALLSIRNNDAILGRILASLEQRGLRDKTDIIIVSDHGFSTINGSTNVVKVLNTNGFKAFREYPKTGPTNGDILVVGGASTLFYVAGHDAAVTERLVRFLQTQPFSGVIFTRTAMDGTFALKDVKLDSPAAPDVVLSMRWSPNASKNGTPGLVWVDSATGGTHGSLSRFDMHNTCIAAGPDFRKGLVSTLASGNVDIAPTILWIFGITPPQPMSGRVLSEALVGNPPEVSPARSGSQDASHTGKQFTWKQHLDFTTVNQTVYFDQGYGELTPATAR
jgi:arylsulfatase A-like enzyme